MGSLTSEGMAHIYNESAIYDVLQDLQVVFGFRVKGF